MSDVGLSFQLSYLQFGQEEWRNELDSELERLRAMRGSIAGWVAAVFDDLEEPDRSQLAKALLYRGHVVAAQALGLALTPSEAAMLERWDSGLLNEQGPSSAPLERSRLRRSSLAKDLRARLRGFGEIEEMDSPLMWRHMTRQGPFTVRTYVDLGGRVWNLSYHHSIFLGEVRIARAVSFLGWLGIGPSKWLLTSNEDGVRAGALITGLCETFFKALPRLLPSV